MAPLLFDRVDFKPKLVKRDKEGHYIVIRGTINLDNIDIVNIYVASLRAPIS